MRRQDQQSAVFYDLSALILNLLRSPPSPIQFSDHIPTPPPAVSSSRRPPVPSITPAGFASLLLGISLALMLCGSVTFFIGFILMPWVLCLVMVLYFVGIFLQFVNAWTYNSLLCHVAAFTSKGGSRLETTMEVNLKWIMHVG